MTSTCPYCLSALDRDAAECSNCGAPHDSTRAVDYRLCPFCRKRLLALASPTCNYCGRHLPESYVKAREAHLRRLTEISGGKKKDEAKGGGVADSLLDLPEFVVDLIDLSDLV